MKIKDLKYLVPNSITMGSLCIGLAVIASALWGFPEIRLEVDVQMLMFAGALDLADGSIAKALGAQSAFGAWLDTIADQVSFGFAPAAVLYRWSLCLWHPVGGALIAAVLPVATFIRLRRFMLDKKTDKPQIRHFSGVSSPAGGAIALLPFVAWKVTGNPAFQHPAMVGAFVLFAALTMNLPILTFSPKGLPRWAFRLAVGMVGSWAIYAIVYQDWRFPFVLTGAYIISIPVIALREHLKRRDGP